MDKYEVENFNRQVGASMSTLDRPKAEVMAEMVKDINPEAKVKVFNQGINDENIREFIDGVDHYVDGLDFFVLDMREKVFDLLYQNEIPSTTAGPFGMASVYTSFLPGKMSFEKYFGLKSTENRKEKSLLFFLGLSPQARPTRYLTDKKSLQLGKKYGPSTAMACQLCSGVAVTDSLKILLGRGRIIHAPTVSTFDAYTNSYYRTWIPFGYKNPLQRIRFHLAKKKML